ncbi:hypothetical protein FBU59_007333 [Linderina macrospora]|uniref:Uncharacterized protein n=1 Tax=Linderina macrospora TaxID=4868 RepID=A0ACC1IXI1_9FUNG|nr:hypothetical protein FBU59_007333 [Linderina macrospora]
MEAEIDHILESLSENDRSVFGVVVTDESGLCLAIRGDNIPEEAGGLVAAIANRSESFLQQPNADIVYSPVAQIEAEDMVITVRRIDTVVVGIFKHRHT